jgi:transcription termination factor Rho
MDERTINYLLEPLIKVLKKVDDTNPQDFGYIKNTTLSPNYSDKKQNIYIALSFAMTENLDKIDRLVENIRSHHEKNGFNHQPS